jgi:hypothetical protein
MEIDSVSKTLFSSFYNTGQWKKSKNPAILKAIISSMGYDEARMMAG